MDNKLTFFSGTDTATLKEEGMDRNHFVSLIVNNAGSYTAAITRKIRSERTVNETLTYESFEGVPIEATNSWKEELEHLQYFHLNIIKEGNDFSFPDVDTRLEEIKKAKETKAKVQSSRYDSCNDNYPGYREALYQTPKVFKQPTLPFEEKEIRNNLSFEPIKEVVDDQDIKADPKLIHSLCLQLLIGSVMIPNESKIDIKRWVNNMKSIVNKRFGTDAKGLKDYQNFVDSMVEFLVWSTQDPTLVNMIDADYMMTVIASGMMEYIGTLPQNTYTKICQSALLNYMQ